MCWISRKSMIFSTCSRWWISSASAGPFHSACQKHVPAHLGQPPGHDVVEGAHALEQRDVLEGAGDALPRDLVGAHRFALLAAEPDLALLRVVEAVDDVEHRRLAGAVRADDGADLALMHVEGDVLQRLDAAEAQRDAAHLQHRPADGAGLQAVVDLLMGVGAVVRGGLGDVFEGAVHAAFSRKGGGADRGRVADFERRRDRALAAVLIGHLGLGVDRGEPS
jgi:hypothetical protein